MSTNQPVKAAKSKAPIGLFIVLGILLLGAAGIGFMIFQTLQRSQLQAKEQEDKNILNVTKGEILVEVIESGPLEASKSIEIKSRVSGRVKELLVDEGDLVQQGQLVAVIDPQETQLQVSQNQAQLRGAQASVTRTSVEIEQRRITAATTLERARSRVRQVELEIRQQPAITSSSIRSAESAYASAQQGLDLLVRVTQPNTVAQVQAALEQAQSTLENARLEQARRKSLLEKGYVSRREVEQADLNVTQAETALNSAKSRSANLANEQALEKRQAEERVRQASQDLDRARATGVLDRNKQEELKQARQQVRDAEAALKDIQALSASRAQQLATVDQLQSVLGDSMRQLGETEIRAPVTGVVTNRLVQLGELVASLSSFSAGTPIFRVEDRSSMRVKLNVNEIDVARLRLGTAAEIRVDAFPDRRFNGRVTKIAPASSGATAGNPTQDAVVKYAVEVTLTETDGELKSGMSAQCRMKVLELKDVVRVPRDFVVSENDDRDHYVLKVGTGRDAKDPKKPKTERAKVVLGASSGAFVQVLSGIAEGDKLYKPDFSGPGRKTFFSDGDQPGQEGAEGEGGESGSGAESGAGSGSGESGGGTGGSGSGSSGSGS